MQNNKTLQKMIKQFEEKNLKELNFKQFIELVQEPSDDVDEDALSLFNSFKRNNQDIFEFEDFIRNQPNKNVKDEEIEKILIEVNEDKDGKLSYNEFIAAIKEMINKKYHEIMN